MIRKITLATGAITLIWLGASLFFEGYNAIEGRKQARRIGH